MKGSLPIVLVAALAVIPLAGGAGEPASPLTPLGAQVEREQEPGELIVRFREGVDAAEQKQTVRAEGGRIARSLRLERTKLVTLPEGESVGQAVAALEDDPDVLFAEPNYRREALAVPNDTEYAQLWAMPKIGAPEAWDLNTGSAGVVVAVIDTGVAYGHPDLAPNLWANNDDDGDGVDDDGNGFVDDLVGWDFVQGDNAPLDFYGHGTHVAGTIGAQGNDALGVTGVNWDVSIMSLRAGDAYGGFPTAATADAIHYACANGARVVNGSYGGSSGSAAELYEINSPACANTLFVFAAGNSGSNNDSDPTFPCAYPSARIVCVAASSSSDGRASYSNFGTTSVDLAAPGGSGGQEILSTIQSYAQIGAIDDFEDAGPLTDWVLYDAPETWGLETGVADSGSKSLADSPGVNYTSDSTVSIRNNAPFNFSGQAGCIAVYDLKLDTEVGLTYATTDWFRVRVGETPATIETLVDEWSEGGGPFMPWYSDLSAADDWPIAYLRFSVDSDADPTTGAGANIDDFQVGCLEQGAGEYRNLTGTSMAAPHVAGAAALVLAEHPTWSTARLKAAILNTVDRKTALWSVGSKGRLNIARALTYTAPNTVFDGGPAARTKKRTATFRFSSNGFRSHFQCKLDGGAWKACTSPKTYKGLRKGNHTFRVRAIDQAGNTDSSPIVRSWRIT